MQAVRLRAGFALAVFAFSNTPQQHAIRQAGGLSLSCFQTFLDSDDEVERATAAFQVTCYLHLPLLGRRRSGVIMQYEKCWKCMTYLLSD